MTQPDENANLKQQAQGIARWVLMFIGGIAVGRGWLSQVELTELVSKLTDLIGPILAVATLVLQLKVNNKRSILLAAAQLPEVKKVVVNDAALAESVPRPEVTTK